jgi:hypothetical protein
MHRADLQAMRQCIDAEIARARLEDLIADCSDADVLWLSEVVQQAFNETALAARISPFALQPTLPAYVRAARKRFSFKD